MMSAIPEASRLSLLGGPLQRLGVRLGLVRGTNTIGLGLAIGLFLWVVLMILALVGGVGENIISLSVVGGHVRLLLVIPLLFVCETVLDPRVAEFVHGLVRSHIIPEHQVDSINATVRRLNRVQASWIPELLLLITAALASLSAMHLDIGGRTSGFDPGGASVGGTGVAWWYAAICLTVFRFLLFRWIWRLCLWTWFLWRVSRLQLRLIPTHPDGVGGLGFLDVAHTHFVPLVLALSALRASTFVEEISTGGIAFEAIFPEIAMILVVDAVLFLGPPLVFARKLWNCRVQGLSTYMELAEQYVSQFDSKWLGKTPPAEPLVGTPDLQSLADLTNSVNVVRDMRWSPISTRLIISLAVAALLPLLPLLLLKYPVGELIRNLFTGIVGL